MAERNFDEEYEHGDGHVFTLGGYTFTTKAVAPPGALLDVGSGFRFDVNFLRRVVRDEDRPNLERIFEMPDVSAGLLDRAPDLHSAALDLLAAVRSGADTSASAGRLQTVLDRIEAAKVEEAGPEVSAVQIDDVVGWLIEEMVHRPTRSPNSSADGAGRGSNGSKVTSSKAGRRGAS